MLEYCPNTAYLRYGNHGFTLRLKRAERITPHGDLMLWVWEVMRNNGTTPAASVGLAFDTLPQAVAHFHGSRYWGEMEGYYSPGGLLGGAWK